MKYTGDYFGYPRCCQREFLVHLKTNTYPSLRRAWAGQMTGFIPCAAHAEEVLAGTITLKDLIKDRVCKKPFPNSGADTAFFEFCKTCKDEP